MDINELYHLVFETYLGIGILVGGGIVVSIIVSAILEVRTRKLYKNHEREEGDDEWALFSDDNDDDNDDDNNDAPADASLNAPADTSSNEHADTSSNAPADTSSNPPADAHAR